MWQQFPNTLHGQEKGNIFPNLVKVSSCRTFTPGFQDKGCPALPSVGLSGRCGGPPPGGRRRVRAGVVLDVPGHPPALGAAAAAAGHPPRRLARVLHAVVPPNRDADVGHRLQAPRLQTVAPPPGGDAVLTFPDPWSLSVLFGSRILPPLALLLLHVPSLGNVLVWCCLSGRDCAKVLI